jgi:hypothetical protein
MSYRNHGESLLIIVYHGYSWLIMVNQNLSRWISWGNHGQSCFMWFMANIVNHTMIIIVYQHQSVSVVIVNHAMVTNVNQLQNRLVTYLVWLRSWSLGTMKAMGFLHQNELVRYVVRIEKLPFWEVKSMLILRFQTQISDQVGYW